MCGRFAIFSEEENEEIRKIVEEINSRLYPSAAKTGEIFPTDTVPIIAAANNKKVLGLAKFGFPNYKSNGVIINARSESLEEKPTFRNLLQTNRCIVPASGYYEWMKEGDRKIKHLISTDKSIVYMAGIYNRFLDKDNKPYMGFVIITSSPTEQISYIHDRMPVILHPETIKTWLLDDYAIAKGLLLPYSGSMHVIKAS